jgi:hypothetical protein
MKEIMPSVDTEDKILSEELKNTIGETACLAKPQNATHWSVRSLAKKFGVSKTAVNTLLRERGIKPHLVKTCTFSTDEYVEETLTVWTKNAQTILTSIEKAKQPVPHFVLDRTLGTRNDVVLGQDKKLCHINCFFPVCFIQDGRLRS